MPRKIKPAGSSRIRLVKLDGRDVGPLLLRYPVDVQFEVPSDQLSLCLQLLKIAMELPNHIITQYADLRTGCLVAIVHGPEFDACNAMAAVQIHKVPAKGRPR